MTFRTTNYRQCVDCGRVFEDGVAESAHRSASGHGRAVLVTGWEHRMTVVFGTPACPKCSDDRKQELLSTTNEWKHHCPRCDVRYNENGELHQI